jgi:hypothetical protein
MMKDPLLLAVLSTGDMNAILVENGGTSTESLGVLLVRLLPA